MASARVNCGSGAFRSFLISVHRMHGAHWQSFAYAETRDQAVLAVIFSFILKVRVVVVLCIQNASARQASCGLETAEKMPACVVGCTTCHCYTWLLTTRSMIALELQGGYSSIHLPINSPSTPMHRASAASPSESAMQCLALLGNFGQVSYQFFSYV